MYIYISILSIYCCILVPDYCCLSVIRVHLAENTSNLCTLVFAANGLTTTTSS